MLNRNSEDYVYVNRFVKMLTIPGVFNNPFRIILSVSEQSPIRGNANQSNDIPIVQYTLKIFV